MKSVILTWFMAALARGQHSPSFAPVQGVGSLQRMEMTRHFYQDMLGFTPEDEYDESAVTLEHYIKFLKVTNRTERLIQMQKIKQDYMAFVDSTAERAKAGHETEDQEYDDYVEYLRSEKERTKLMEMDTLKTDYQDFVKDESHKEHEIATTAKGLRYYMNHIKSHRMDHSQAQAKQVKEANEFYTGLLDYLADKEEDEDGVVSGAGLQHYFDFLESNPAFSSELQLVHDVQGDFVDFVNSRTTLEVSRDQTSAPDLQEYLDFLKHAEKNRTRVRQMQKLKEDYLKFLATKPGVVTEGSSSFWAVSRPSQERSMQAMLGGAALALCLLIVAIFSLWPHSQGSSSQGSHALLDVEGGFDANQRILEDDSWAVE